MAEMKKAALLGCKEMLDLVTPQDAALHSRKILTRLEFQWSRVS